MLPKSSQSVVRSKMAQVHILIAPRVPGVASPTILWIKAGLLLTSTMSRNPRLLTKQAMARPSQTPK
jgi:hypothetical protein